MDQHHIPSLFKNVSLCLKEEKTRLKRIFTKPFYITTPYTFLAVCGDSLEVRKKRELLMTVPFRRISEIIILCKTSFSSHFIARCIEHGIPVSIMLDTGYHVTTIKPDSKYYYGLAAMHTAKFDIMAGQEKLTLAKEFAGGKIENYLSLFREKRCSSPPLHSLETFRDAVYNASSIDQVRGYEGSAAKVSYSVFGELITDKEFALKKRNRKNPDKINSLLNLGYYLLFSRINSLVRVCGLNPYAGILHSKEDNYESFVCDVEELFRPEVDNFIIKLVNLHTINKDSFIQTKRGWLLKKDKLALFLERFEGELERVRRGNSLSLKKNIYEQVIIFKNWIQGKGSPFFYRRK